MYAELTEQRVTEERARYDAEVKGRAQAVASGSREQRMAVRRMLPAFVPEDFVDTEG